MDISAFGPALLMVQRRSGRSYVPAGERSIRWRRWLWRKKPRPRLPRASNSSAFRRVVFQVLKKLLVMFYSTMSACFAVDFWSESRIPKFVFLCSKLAIWIMINELPCCVSWTYKIAWQHYNPRLLGLFPKYYKVVKGDTQCEDELYRWNTGIEFLGRKKVCDVYSFIFLFDFKIKYSLS